MSKKPGHKCLRCAVTVDDDKLAVSACNDKECPLNELREARRAEQSARPGPTKPFNPLIAG